VDPASLRAFVRRRFSREETVGLSFTLSLAVCVLLAVAFGILARTVARNTWTLKSFDAAMGQFFYGLRSPGATEWMRAATFLGDSRFLSVATPLVIVGLLLAGHRISALLFAGSVLGGFVVQASLKVAFARARPDRWPALVEETSYAFPSGHAVMTTVFFGGLAAVVFHLTRRRELRILAAAAAAVLILTVASSRVYLGAHWASDTVAGILLGLFWVVVYDGGTEYLTRRRRPPV
jgi:undecaprenyl-diphosphatase